MTVYAAGKAIVPFMGVDVPLIVTLAAVMYQGEFTAPRLNTKVKTYARNVVAGISLMFNVVMTPDVGI